MVQILVRWFLYWFRSGDVCLGSCAPRASCGLWSTKYKFILQSRWWEMCGLRFAETSITKLLLLKLMFWTTSFKSQPFRCHWLFTVTCINSPSLFKCHASIALIILDSNPLKPSLKFLLSMPGTHGLISSYLQTKSTVLVFHRLL